MVFGFFRKYQKLIFGVIGGVVMLSFSFFGTYSAMKGPEKVEGPVARTLPDGTRVSAREWQQLVVFLRSSRISAQLARDPLQANLLNDGVLEIDFLATGMAPKLGEALGAEGERQLAEREGRERLKSPYQHPHDPSIGVRALWEMLSPGMVQQWNGWMASQGAPAAERWQRRAELYLAQSRLPPEWVRKLLLHQEGARAEPDPKLQHGDLALFGYHSLEEWFGKPLIEEAASWILHGAMYAEQQGIHVSLDEAQRDLARQGQEAYALLERDPRLQGVSFSQFMQHQVAQWAGDQELATRLWQRVLLMRRLLSSQADVALTAQLPYQKFGQYAQLEWKLKRYELAPEFAATTASERGELKAYLEAISPSKSIPEVAVGLAKWPHLVGRSYQVELCSTTVAELEAQVPLQQARSWQQAHWGELQKQFSFLSGHPDLTQLDPKQRRQLDQVARQRLVQEHPEWMQERLAKSEVTGRTLIVSYGDQPSQLAGLTHRQLMERLEATDPIIDLDGHYYKIHVLERSEPRWLTFREARELKLLPASSQAEHPLQGYLSEALAALGQGADAGRWITSVSDPLQDQFKLQVREETVDRGHRLAALEPGSWSALEETHFYLCRAIEEAAEPFDRVAAERQLIEQTARREMAQQLASAASRGAATLY
jgi:hypothetical protein